MSRFAVIFNDRKVTERSRQSQRSIKRSPSLAIILAVTHQEDMHMQLTRHLAPAVAMALALSATFASVADAVSVEGNAASIEVRYGDLELGNPLAIDRLYARIAAAAENVCGDYDARDLRARSDWRACYDAALADAVARAPHPAVAERHRSEQVRRASELGRAPVG
jgi:UrcA family protein